MFFFLSYDVLADKGIASESDFASVAKELTPDQLKQFYYALSGINHQEIEKAIAASGTQDLDLQAKSVFRKWGQLNGSAATRRAIVEALLDLDLRNVVDKLEKIWVRGKCFYMVGH